MTGIPTLSFISRGFPFSATFSPELPQAGNMHRWQPCLFSPHTTSLHFPAVFLVPIRSNLLYSILSDLLAVVHRRCHPCSMISFSPTVSLAPVSSVEPLQVLYVRTSYALPLQAPGHV
jgi:hypothetical protein